MENKLSISRRMPKNWQNKVSFVKTLNLDPVNDIKEYMLSLYGDLKNIEKYYKDEVKDELNIDDELLHFNDLCDKIISSFIGESYFNSQKKEYPDSMSAVLAFHSDKKAIKEQWQSYERFKLLDKQTIIANNKSMLKYDKEGYACGFSDKAYNEIEPLLKQLFMLEKLCSFTTKKLWNNAITKLVFLDFKKDFKLLVKVEVEGKWRKFGDSDETKQYFDKKLYKSISIVDKDHIKHIFKSDQENDGTIACVVMKPESDKIICGYPCDAYTEETINNKEPGQVMQKSAYTDINLISKKKNVDDTHRLFSQATMTCTPDGLLDRLNTSKYNEIIMENPTPLGVFAPNKNCVRFAEIYAYNNCLPYLGCIETKKDDLQK